MGPKQLEVFTRKLIWDNALRSAEMGNRQRPFGVEGIEEIKAEKDKVDAVVEKTPEVVAALEARQKVAAELVDELKSLDLISPEVEPADYYHQQVLLYHQAAMRGARGLKKTKKGFQKKRVEGIDDDVEELDYNTKYIESETAWMADAYSVIAKEKLWRKLQAEYDVTGELEAEAKAKDVPLSEVLRGRKDLGEFFLKPGNQFYRALTIPEKVVEQLNEGILENIDPDTLREVWALAKAPRAIMPVELVDQLNSMEKPKPEGFLGKMADDTLAAWKGWSTVVSPKRTLKYQISNLTGDLDPIIGGAPGVVMHAHRASKELLDYYVNKKLPRPPS
jgi:hypothetical protein